MDIVAGARDGESFLLRAVPPEINQKADDLKSREKNVVFLFFGDDGDDDDDEEENDDEENDVAATTPFSSRRGDARRR